MYVTFNNVDSLESTLGKVTTITISLFTSSGFARRNKKETRIIVIPYKCQEGRYPPFLKRVVGFHKGFEHNELGELTETGLNNYRLFVNLLVNGDVVGVAKEINFAPENKIKLINPFSGFGTNLFGSTVLSNKTRPPPRDFGSEHASEMIELYSQGLVLDVPFIEWDNSLKIQKQINILIRVSFLLLLAKPEEAKKKS